MNVAVIGASDKPDRFSYKAVVLLQSHGHKVYPVHQRVKEVNGLTVYKTVEDIKDSIDTVTLYVGADISTEIAANILALKPSRIIFNPGAENPLLAAKAIVAGISAVNDCTLVMLNTNKF